MISKGRIKYKNINLPTYINTFFNVRLVEAMPDNLVASNMSIENLNDSQQNAITLQTLSKLFARADLLRIRLDGETVSLLPHTQNSTINSIISFAYRLCICLFACNHGVKCSLFSSVLYFSIKLSCLL